MYENEIYSELNTVNRTAETGAAASGETGMQSGSANSTGGTPYFDYISTPGRNVNPVSGNVVGDRRAESSSWNTNAVPEGKTTGRKNSQKKKSGAFRKIVLSVSLGLCFGLFAGLGFYAVQLGTGQSDTREKKWEERLEALEEKWEESDAQEASGNSITVVQPSNTSTPASIKVTQVDASEMVKQVMPSMVSIVNNYTVVSSYWGQTYREKEAASGSGIIVAQNDKELLIVSNNHVVEDADSLIVTFIDGSEAEAAIKGLDADMDLAVIAVSLDSLSKDTRNAISIAALGDSDALELGEPVIAIGNALGYGQSVSGGMISALGRELTFDDGSKGIFIQTDAAINPGNSGGALLNLSGEVIGINSSKIGGTYVEGMGYAIPITAASPIIAELMERETRTMKVEESKRGYMGIELQSVTDDASNRYNMPKGVFVYSVEPGLAADEAGIKKGDIIVGFDGQKISSQEDLLGVIQYYRAGETVVVAIRRLEDSEYVAYDIEITLGVRP